MKKRFTAALLSACLALGPCAGYRAPVYGAQQDAVQTDMESTLEVEITSAQQLPFEGEVLIEIDDGKGRSEQKKLTIAKNAFASANFKVPQGDYTLRIQAEKFAGYTQQIHAEAGWTHTVKLYSAQIQTGGSAVPGWLRLGDVDLDRDIDDDDSNALSAAIHEGKTDAIYDLNGDGKVDLTDLHILVQSMEEQQQSTIEKNWVVDPSAAQAENGTTLADGTEFAALFREEGSVKLQNSSGNSISENNPVEFSIALGKDGSEQAPLLGGMTIKAPEQTDGADSMVSQIADGTVTVVYQDENGAEQTKQLSLKTAQDAMALSAFALREKGASVITESDGSLVLDFGGQIAVKRVSIRITGTTKKEQKLVEIAKVTFVNDMENRIPAPQLDIPTILSVKPGSKMLTVTWSAQKNITGYELYISGPVKNQSKEQSQIIAVSDVTYDVSSINWNNLVNYKEYTLKVRSVNGDWKSPWSEIKTAKPLPQAKPAAPDNVTASGGYRSVTVSWKDMDDSDGYMVYYKEKDADTYMPAVEGFVQTKEGTDRLKGTSHTIHGLKEHTSYLVYVISWNEFGWSGQSLVSEATTRSEAVPILPSYRLLNTSNGVGKVSAHIENAVIGGSNAKMVNSALDTQKNSGLGLVDNDYASYWYKEDWDDGVGYPESTKGMTVTFDQEYRMNYFTFAAADQKYGFNTVRVEYWNEADMQNARTAGARLLEKYDVNDNPYYIVKLDETIKAKKIKMSIGRTYQRAEMKVGEIRFYQYDSLEDEIMQLYMDDMHTTLRSDVTADTIQALENRLETVDTESGEKHPLYQELALELRTAREILTTGLAAAQEIHPQITAQKDKHLGFGGLNAWQPLGRTAYAGETLLVYVGHQTKRTGDAAQLQLVFTQHHAESSGLAHPISLKVGRNMITVPQMSDKLVERGGQLYVAYTGNNDSDKYAVRISGGSAIPALDVYGKTGNERTQAIHAYIQELEAHVASLEEQHKTVHEGNKHADVSYDMQNCILNATDIMMEQMMYSLPASQVLNAVGKDKTTQEKAAQLDRSLQAMEQMMTLFYQHKGLSDQAGTAKGNQALPAQHLNIRYMRMFAGAFMYAAGNHIGIEWGSTTLAGAADSWNGFGWGIAHEIGHDINQGTYAVAEVTNNYFAQLMKKIAEGTTRFTYDNVYKKVTSGTIGRSSNVMTQLAMYWQLYLAYGKEKNDGRIYDNYNEQFENLFFARVDTYSRNPEAAPQGKVTLGGDTDQNLMRLACAAAEKNILSFFERWGMVPDNDTINYAKKFETETKAIYYVNDAIRDYRIEHAAEEQAQSVAGKDVVAASVKAESNKVTVTIRTDVDADRIAGFEIIRSMVSNGKTESKVVGYQPIETAASTVYTDYVSAVNNRVLSYEVRAVDKFLNYSNGADAGSVKIETDGVLDKSGWTVDTNMISDDDAVTDTNEDNPDSGYDADQPNRVEAAKVSSIERVIDNNIEQEGTYQESAEKAADTAVITIDMHRTEAVTALKYKGSNIDSLTVEVGLNGKDDWTIVKENSTTLKDAKDSETAQVWFDAVNEAERENWIGTYDARYIRLTLKKSGPVTIREMEICGPSGDNLEFLMADGTEPAVGKLDADYQYGPEKEDVIPKGSLVFTGTYKGNPAYNVIVLYDTQGNVIGAKNGEVHAEQVIFAPDPKDGNLGETSNGTWVYYVEKEYWDANTIQSVQGVRGELYRVDDAKTMEAERIVSDTQLIKIPSELQNLTLTGSLSKGGQTVKDYE